MIADILSIAFTLVIGGVGLLIFGGMAIHEIREDLGL
jgi:hypothetical protein